MNSIHRNEMWSRMGEERATPEAKTWVGWDIDSCPVPDGYDSRLVVSSIESALRKEGYGGPVTITALGNLKLTLKRSPHVLPALSAAGVHLYNKPLGKTITELMDKAREWTWYNPPPAKLLLITGVVDEEEFSFRVSELQSNGYTVLHACPRRVSHLVYNVFVESIFVWEPLLKAMSGKTRAASLHCSLCRVSCQCFESFAEHLMSKHHVDSLLSMVERPVSGKLRRMLANESYQNDATTMVEKQSKKRSFEEAAIQREEELRGEEWDRITL